MLSLSVALSEERFASGIMPISNALTDPRVPRRTGWKHTDNVKLHYKQFLEEFVQKQATANGGKRPETSYYLCT